MIFPIYGKTCSKPPTSIDSPHDEIAQFVSVAAESNRAKMLIGMGTQTTVEARELRPRVERFESSPRMKDMIDVVVVSLFGLGKLQ